MASRSVDGKHLVLQKASKKSDTLPTKSDVPSETILFDPSSLPPTSQTVKPTTHQLTRAETKPKSRIVIVRTSGNAQNEQEPVENNDSARSQSVELPAILTNGRTSIYVIRRPIPPNEQQRETLLFKPVEEIEQTTTTTNQSQETHAAPYTGENPPSQTADQSSSFRPKSSKRGWSSHSAVALPSPSPDSDEENSKHPDGLQASPTASDTLRQLTRRGRSKSPASDFVRLTYKTPSKPKQRPLHLSPRPFTPSPSPPHNDKLKDVNPKRNHFSFKRTKTIALSADLPVSEPTDDEFHTSENSHPRRTRKIRPQKSNVPRIKSSRSIVLVDPDDQTTIGVKNSPSKSKTIKPVTKQPTPSRTKREHQVISHESTEELIKTSRWHTCLACLSRHMCLIIIICIILILIGLAGVGVSAYFLTNSSSSSNTPKIVGVVIGGVFALAALIFLCTVLGCIASRDGYFSYSGNDSRVGGRALAIISASHPNSSLYASPNYSREHPTNPTSSSTSTVPITRQKTMVNEGNSTGAQNMIIEMPERLLAARQLSPKAHERKLTRLVTNVGHAIEDAKKRYNGDVPNKVVVQIDDNPKLPT